VLLVVDVGNTNIVLGVYEGEKLIVNWRVSTDRQRTADELGMMVKHFFDYHGLTMSMIKDIAISSVVPPLTPILEAAFRRYFRVDPLVIGPGVKTGMPIRFDNPKEVGADRIVNAVAAYEIYGGPVIAVDFGTATTFDAISGDGEYLGGAIAPGIGISMEALFQHAAKLPRVELARPKSVIAKNTVAAMQAGIVFGFVGQVDGIVSKMQVELGGKAFVVATGGLAKVIGPETATIDKIDPFLTLEGLKIIYRRNLRGQ
jgi:type III pantothenate kinase